MPEMKVALRAHIDKAFDFQGFNAQITRKASWLTWIQIDQRTRIWSTKPIIETMRNQRDLVALRSADDLTMKLCEMIPKGSYTINELELVGGKCIIVIPEEAIKPENFSALAQAADAVEVVRGLTISAESFPIGCESGIIHSSVKSNIYNSGNRIYTRKPSLDEAERTIVRSEMARRIDSFLLPIK